MNLLIKIHVFVGIFVQKTIEKGMGRHKYAKVEAHGSQTARRRIIFERSKFEAY